MVNPGGLGPGPQGVGEELSGTRSVEGVLRILRSPQLPPAFLLAQRALMVSMTVVVAFLQPVL